MSRLATFLIGLSFLGGVGIAYPPQVRTYATLTLDFRLNHLAVIGDSYTTGTDEGGLGARSWPSRAWQALGARGRGFRPMWRPRAAPVTPRPVTTAAPSRT